jgi:predicted O-methyltransferase YrrM
MNIEELIERHHANNAGFCRHYMTLYSIVLGMETKSAFEFGSGFSSKVILTALEKTGGNLTTCDVRPLSQTAIFYDKEEIKNNNWKYLQKDSLNAVDDFKDSVFDFVLHDGSHTWQVVKKDMENIIPRMKTGGIFLLHDTAHPTEKYELHKAVESLTWCKHSVVTLPYGYGLSIIVIEEDFGHGKVNIQWRKH